MMEKDLLNYFHSLSKEFQLLFAETISLKKSGQLHHLRVNLKKQFAFFHLMAALDEGFPLIMTRKPVRALMKQTSAMRDAQVMTKLVKAKEEQLLLPPLFSKRLKAEKKSIFKSAEKCSPKVLQQADAIVNERIPQLSGSTHLWAKLHRYFQEQTDLLRQLGNDIRATQKISEVHRFRKELKTLMFNLLLLQELAPGFQKLKPVLVTLDEFQHLLGEWNDRVVLLQTMKKNKRHVPKALRQLVKSERRLLFFSILERLEGFPVLSFQIQQALNQLLSEPKS